MPVFHRLSGSASTVQFKKHEATTSRKKLAFAKDRHSKSLPYEEHSFFYLKAQIGGNSSTAAPGLGDAYVENSKGLSRRPEGGRNFSGLLGALSKPIKSRSPAQFQHI